MSVPFEIKVGNNSDRGMVVELGKVPAFAIPGHIAFGISPLNKKVQKLSDWYSKCFTTEDPKYAGFRHTVATIQKHSVSLGKMTIICGHKSKDLHTQGFIKFFTDHQETIALVTPYILDNGKEEAKDTKEDDKVEHTPNPSTGNEELDKIQLNGAGVDRLSISDITQIKTLLAEQFSKDGVFENTGPKEVTIEDNKSSEAE